MALGTLDFIDAFWTLSSDRQIYMGGGLGRIPYTSIDRYASRNGFDDPESFHALHTLIRALDGVFLEHQNRKDKDG